MSDVFSASKRSEIMSQIRGKNTLPEIIVRRIVHRLGYRFSLHKKGLPGIPDIVLTRHKKIIFVHGCYWHGHKGCVRSQRPKSNIDFWNKKINSNIDRDKKILRILRNLGWSVLIIWQCQIKNQKRLEARILHFMEKE